MPKEKDFKRRVRDRMRKTGEAYTAARAALVKKRERGGARSRPALPDDPASVAGMKDDAVRAKTGRDWRGWVAALDAGDADALGHAAIAARLHEEFGLSGWWAQMVAVGYERLRGLRAKGQRREGTWDVGKSKTVPVPLARLYRAFGARERGRWLGDAPLVVRKATREKSMRCRWGDDDTPVDLTFWAKGPQKSQVQLQHGKLPSQARAAELRAFWSERLAALAEHLLG